jgi:hypothetical protein
MLNVYKLSDYDNYYFLFYALLEANSSIKPNIESNFNRWDVKDLRDILHIIKKDEFALNTRVLKFILAEPHDDFKVFCNKLDPVFIRQLYYAALNNGYAYMTELKNNFVYLNYLINNETAPYLFPN